MILAGKEIPNDLIEMYIRSIKHVRTSPTLSADVTRMEMHNRIIEEGNTTRHDYAFLAALSDVVMDELGTFI